MSKEKLKKLKQESRQLKKRREQLLEEFFAKERLIAGSYMETRMRCGTAGCHCHTDGGHPTVRISRWVEGKLKNKIVRMDDREWVAEAVENYKSCKRLVSEIAKINALEKEVLKQIIDEKAENYE